MLPGFAFYDRGNCLTGHSEMLGKKGIGFPVLVTMKNLAHLPFRQFCVRVARSTWGSHVRSALSDHVLRVFLRRSWEEMGGVAAQRIVAIRAIVARVLIVGDLANCRHQRISVCGDGSSLSVSHDKEVSISTIRRARRPWPTRVWSARSIDMRPKQLCFIAMAADALALIRARLAPFVALRSSRNRGATNGTQRIRRNRVAQGRGAAIRTTDDFGAGGMKFVAARGADFGNLEAHRRLQSEVPRPRSLAARGGFWCPNYTMVTRTLDRLFGPGGAI